jgi:Uma2 family endonuclease
LREKRNTYREVGAKEFWAVDLEEKWVSVENFVDESVTRFDVDDVVKSHLFPEFEFEVRSILKKVL